MHRDSFTAYCPDAVYATDSNFDFRLIDRRSEIIGHRTRVATPRAKMDSLSVCSTSLVEGEPEPDWIYFNIRKTPQTSVHVNHSTIKQGTHALVLMAGGGFVATMPPGYSSYGVGVHRELIQEGETLGSGSLQIEGRTAIYGIKEALFTAINRELCLIEHSDCDEAMFEDRLSDLTTTILTCLDRATEVGTSNRQRIVFKSIKYIRSQNGRISSQELADKTHCSVRTLQYAFRRTCGISPKQFIDRYRLSQIRSTLLQSAHRNSLRIKDIARLHGFKHQGNLSKAYRELFGEAPSETIRRIKQCRSPVKSGA